jgi:hypothetical protein
MKRHKIIKLKGTQSNKYCNVCGKKREVAIMEYNDDNIDHYPIKFRLCEECILDIYTSMGIE